MKKIISSYLSQLRFDPKLENLWISKYLINFRYVALLIIVITSSGIFSYFNLPRRLNPEVKIPIVSVSTALPGAGAQDIESLVTIPLEDEIASIDKVDTITSTSQESLSVIIVEFNSSVDPNRAKDNVKSAVDSVSDLPQETQATIVEKLDFENQPVWTFLVTTTKDDASLAQFAKNLEGKIEKIPTVKSVEVTGIEEQEVQIIVKVNVQREFNIDPFTLSQLIRTKINAQPLGTVNTKSSSFTLTLDPTVSSVNDLRELELNVSGQIVKLADVAEIFIRAKPNIAKTFFASSNQEPTRGVIFSVFKSDSANIDKSVSDVKEVTDAEISRYQESFNIVSIRNLAQLVDDQFNELALSFRDTILLVIAILFVFLGIRQALIVAFTIPLSFLVAFTIMDVSGLTINFLTLFSLILALGLLVDDAIVVVTAVTAYFKTKKFTPKQTGLLVLRDFVVPIWSTTITAVWAFLPLLVASGIIGEFIKSISIVVSTTLIASTAIALLITLPLMMVFLKPAFPNRVKILLNSVFFVLLVSLVVFLTRESPLLSLNIVAAFALLIIAFKFKKQLVASFTTYLDKIINTKKVAGKISSYADHGVFDSEKFALAYRKFLDRILSSPSARGKTLVAVIVFALFCYLLLPLGFVKNEFFPKTDSDTIYVSLQLPSGTNLQTAEKETNILLSQLKNTKGTKFVTSEIAKIVSTTEFFAGRGGFNNILFTLVLEEENSLEIAQILRKSYQNYTTGKLSVIELTGGPPAGSDLQIKYSGEDLTTLNQLADKTVKFLESQPSTTNVEKSIKPATSRIIFVPDKIKTAQYHVAETALASKLRTFASGFTLDTDVNFNNDTYDIVFRNNDEVQSPVKLSGLIVNTPLGDVPLSEIGQFVIEPNPTQITRENQKRTISVSASTKTGYTVPEENKKLEEFAKKLDLPSGYLWETGGVNEENQQSLNSIFRAMAIALVLITTTMVIQFGSFRKAFIVLLKIPLAISGVFLVFAFTATPLSFPTVVGILALFGITVYQSMLIVDKIGRNTRAGMKLKQAISDGAASRVEPILFGTLATVFGLIPITLSNPLWRGLGGAIIAGLIFSGAIMLLFIPVVYYIIFEKEVK